MDVLRLNSFGSWPTYKADALIEGWTSMIWTERYQQPSDFEMRTPFVQETLDLLPPDDFCCISLRDTDEVMIVEDYEIDDDGSGGHELVVRGRGFETFMEQRHIIVESSLYGKKYKMGRMYTPVEAAEVLAYNYLANAGAWDVTRPASANRANYGRMNLYNVIISDTTPAGTEGDRRRRWLKGGESVYDRVLDFAVRSDVGIRSIRPNSEGRMVAVSDGDTDRGAISILGTAITSELRVDFFNGLRRDANQTARDIIVWSHAAGHLTSDKYKFSNSGFKNLVRLGAPPPPGSYLEGTLGDYKERSAGPYYGSDLRMEYLDGGSPGPNESYDEFREDLEQMGSVHLKRARRERLMNVAISPNVPEKFKVDYFLGDTVTVIGRYGIKRNMVIGEYIRAANKEGENAYPGLLLPSEI